MYQVKSLSAIETFSWSKLTCTSDLKTTAPTLCTILDKCISAKTRSNYFSYIDKDIIVAVVGGILFKNLK